MNLLSRWRSRAAAGALAIIGLMGLMGLMGLTGCSTLSHTPVPTLESGARWAVLPIANDTETPLAGNRAAAIAEAVLRSHGVRSLERAPLSADTLFDPIAAVPLTQSLSWARNAGIRYALTGTVTEWRYRAEGAPTVGLTLQLIDVGNGQVLWSASGSRSGWSRQSLAGTAQQLIEALVQALAVAGS